MGDPLARYPHFCLVAGSLGQGQVKGLPAGCGNLDLAPQQCLGQLNFPGHGDIVILHSHALGQGGRGFYIEVTHRSAVGAGLPLAGQADFFPLGQPFGNLYFNGLGLTALADGNGFFGAVDQFLNRQRDFILEVFAPDRGLAAASATAHVLGEGVAGKSPAASETGTALAESP